MVSEPVCVLEIDCKTATAEEVEHVDTTFKLRVNNPPGRPLDADGTVPIHGFAAWFDVMFAGPQGLAGPTVTLSTAPAIDKDVPGACRATAHGLQSANGAMTPFSSRVGLMCCIVVRAYCIAGPWTPPEALSLGGLGLTDVNPVTHWKQTVWFNGGKVAVRGMHCVGGGALLWTQLLWTQLLWTLVCPRRCRTVVKWKELSRCTRMRTIDAR
jgi:hypothetical protein